MQFGYMHSEVTSNSMMLFRRAFFRFNYLVSKVSISKVDERKFNKKKIAIYKRTDHTKFDNDYER
jgi:hypothetical protein